MKNTLHFVLVICVSFLFLTNCEDINNNDDVSPEDSTAAVVLVANANASLFPVIGALFATDPDSAQTILNDLDLSESRGFYLEASEKDWRNQDAHFGLGFTSVLMLSQNTQLNEIFGSSAKVFEPFRSEGESSNPVGYALGLPLSSSRVSGMIALTFEIPLALGRLQFESLNAFNAFQADVIDTFIPMIDAGLSALDSLNNDPAFVFNLGTTTHVALIDVIALESSLFALQAMFKGLAAYNFELNTQDPAEIIAGLSQGSYGALNENGETLLSEAHAAALTSIERADQVLSLLLAETPTENHLLVQFDASESSQIQANLELLRSTLNGATDIEYGFLDERGDVGIDGITQMDISQYYLNPVIDFKILLPPYTMATTTAYNYNQVTVYEQIHLEENEVVVAGLNNTPVSINIQYSESNADTSAIVTLGTPPISLSYNLLIANPSELPVAIWEVWAEILLAINEYSDELHNYPEISFQWSGVITTGSTLIIDGEIAIDYLERDNDSSYIAPDRIWTATNYADWLAGWLDPTAQGMYPEFLAEDLALMLGMAWE